MTREELALSIKATHPQYENEDNDLLVDGLLATNDPDGKYAKMIGEDKASVEKKGAIDSYNNRMNIPGFDTMHTPTESQNKMVGKLLRPSVILPTVMGVMGARMGGRQAASLAALGAAGGEGYEIAAENVGHFVRNEPIDEPGEINKRLLKSAALGAGAELGGRAILNVAKKGYDLTKGVTSDVYDFLKAKNIPVKYSDIMKSGTIANFEKWLSRHVGAAKKYEDFSDKQFGFIKNEVKTFLKKFDSKLTDTEINIILRKAAIKKSEDIAKHTNKLYEIAGKYVKDDLAYVPVKSFEAVSSALDEIATGRLKGGEALLKNLNDLGVRTVKASGILDASGKEVVHKARMYPVRYRTLNKDIKTLGALIKKERYGGFGSGQARGTSEEGKIYSQIKEALEVDRDEMLKGNEQGGALLGILQSSRLKYGKTDPEAFKAFSAARESYKEEKAMFDPEVVKNIINSDPTTSANLLLNVHNIEAITHIKKVVGEKAMDRVRERSIKSIVSEALEKNEKNFVSQGINDALSGYDERVLTELIGEKTLKEIKEIAYLTAKMEDTSEIIGAKTSAADWYKTTSHTIAGFFMKFGNNVVGKVMLSDKGRKLLLDGLRVPQGSKEAAKAIIRLNQYVALNIFDNTEIRDASDEPADEPILDKNSKDFFSDPLGEIVSGVSKYVSSRANSPEDIKADHKSGKLTREEALQKLRLEHGYQ